MRFGLHRPAWHDIGRFRALRRVVGPGLLLLAVLAPVALPGGAGAIPPRIGAGGSGGATAHQAGPTLGVSAAARVVTVGQRVLVRATFRGVRLPPGAQIVVNLRRLDRFGNPVGAITRVRCSVGARACQFRAFRSRTAATIRFQAVIRHPRLRLTSRGLTVEWRAAPPQPQPPQPQPPQPQAPQPQPQPPAPATAKKLRLTLTGRQGTTYIERNLVTGLATEGGGPYVTGTSGVDVITGTVTLDGALPAGQMVFVYATLRGVPMKMCLGPGGCTFTFPPVAPTDGPGFEQAVATICPPSAPTTGTAFDGGCLVALNIRRDVYWVPVP